VSCVHPSILGFYTQHVSIPFFKVQCTIGCDLSSVWVETEEEAGTRWGLEEGISDLCIYTFILVCGRHLQHGGSPGHVFLEANSVYILAEHWGIIIGVSDVDPDLSGAAQRRVSAIHSSQD
uniref:Uncharacterized protein n=1 Tax=Oryctolagus cuniculus TaxID=9986 RepID=A0A5F9CY47_RABIT